MSQEEIAKKLNLSAADLERVRHILKRNAVDAEHLVAVARNLAAHIRAEEPPRDQDIGNIDKLKTDAEAL